MKLLFAALCVAGLLSAPSAARADEKKGEAKGTFTLDGKTYKLTSALAYATKKFDMTHTVVYLSEKPLDTTKLKASFKKNGTDEDFFASGPHVRLIFDDTGKLFQIGLHAGGGNVILQGDPNIKAEAALKNGAAKGTAKTVKPEKDYELDTTFEVKLMKP